MQTEQMDQPRMFFVGEDWHGSNATSCRRAFQRLGCEVADANPREFFPLWQSFYLRAVRRVLMPSLVREFNRALVARVAAFRPHLVFVFKGAMVHPRSLLLARRCGARIFNFYPDPDPFADYRRFGNDFTECIQLYDCMFTPKSYQLESFEIAGARRVEFLPYAYDAECHRCCSPSNASGDSHTDVVVVATWRPQRAAMLEQLVAHGFPHRLSVWGNQWERLPSGSPLRPFVKFQSVTGDGMSRVLSSAKIALAFLTPPDLHTARSFEIPATGTLMLAERTTEHLEFFREGEEIACFDDISELRTQIDYYLSHDDDRRRIAEAGRRAVEGRHEYRVRMACVLEMYQQIAQTPVSESTRRIRGAVHGYGATRLGCSPATRGGVSIGGRDDL